MRVTILGTGNMARGVAARALAGGHHVTFVGTHIDKASHLADELTGQGEVRPSETAEGDVVVLAVPFTQAPHAVRQHADELAGAVLVDVTNPVDLGVLEPLDVAPMRSGAETIAATAPDGARVVKAFNTNFAGPLIAGAVDGQILDVFVAGDDDEANATVMRLVEDGGLRPIPAGPLARARELEAVGYLHMAIQGALGTGFGSALKVVAPRT
jgi:8-hydroxy-5-deazaflavin:NADPH oxidoreductase